MEASRKNERFRVLAEELKQTYRTYGIKHSHVSVITGIGKVRLSQLINGHKEWTPTEVAALRAYLNIHWGGVMRNG